MKSILICVGCLSFAFLVVVGCAAGVQLTRDKIQDPGQLAFNGYTEKQHDCYHCHNGDGRGSGRGSDLSKSIPKMSDETVRKVIMEGSGFMPAFSATLEEQELGQIVAWLRSSFGQEQKKEIKSVETEEVAE